jgi:hypothetical protein
MIENRSQGCPLLPDPGIREKDHRLSDQPEDGRRGDFREKYRNTGKDLCFGCFRQERRAIEGAGEDSWARPETASSSRIQNGADVASTEERHDRRFHCAEDDGPLLDGHAATTAGNTSGAVCAPEFFLSSLEV